MFLNCITRGGFMRNTAVVLALALLAAVGLAQESSAKPETLTVVFKDGHQKTFSFGEVTRIEFKDNSMVVTRAGHEENIGVAQIARIDFTGGKPLSAGRNHFVGKWEVGVGVGGGHFFITLDPDGQARKTLGASHGTWTVVNGEARISWDDGWHDIIRRVGAKHEKQAFEPGKSLDQKPSNVTEAKNTTAQPI
jgi:hypothetical protein